MKRAIFALAAALAALLLLAGESATADRELRVGYVIQAGVTPTDRDLFGLPYLGFIRAVKAFGVEGRVVEVAGNQDPTGALSLLARQRYDLIIMGAFGPAALQAVALDFPNARFLLPDLPQEALPNRPKNVQGTVYRAEEAGYLAGYLAGLMERRKPGHDVISSVGGYKSVGVDRWIVGYRLGARKADPGITVLNTYTNDFANSAKCRTAALSQFARGAGVVFDVAGGCGLGALEAAREKGVWGIGVDVDQSFLGPQILTSAVIRLDRPVFTAIQQLVKGEFRTGGNTVFDLRNGGVGLGKISPKVPPPFLRQLDRVRRQIIAGRIRVPRVT